MTFQPRTISPFDPASFDTYIKLLLKSNPIGELHCQIWESPNGVKKLPPYCDKHTHLHPMSTLLTSPLCSAANLKASTTWSNGNKSICCSIERNRISLETFARILFHRLKFHTVTMNRLDVQQALANFRYWHGNFPNRKLRSSLPIYDFCIPVFAWESPNQGICHHTGYQLLELASAMLPYNRWAQATTCCMRCRFF